MTRITTDIAIAGAGPAGLIAAATLAHAGWQVLLIDPVAPVTDGKDSTADRRSTAFLQPAIALFERTGIWDDLAPHAIPLDALRIVDLAGEPPEYRDERVFNSGETGPGPFGWNFLNWQIRAALMGHLTRQPNVTLKFGAGLTRLMTRTGEARLTLADGTRITARLAIAADGRNSTLRDLAGITTQTTRYGQQSLAFTAKHDVPHGNISTEIYHEGGPFTMVPLAELDGKPASAIVWMNPGRRAQELLAMDPAPFNAEMLRRTAGLFGALDLASPRGAFPIITRRADALTTERVAVIAEAAHVLPPIGAQGLNTSVNDIAALTAAIGTTGDPGRADVLTRYEAARKTDIARRGTAIDLFNRVTRSGLPPLQTLRLSGLKLAHDITPLRRGLMRAGLGPE